MSFNRKGPGVLASAAIGAAVGMALVGGAIALLSLPAFAQQASSAASPAHVTSFQGPSPPDRLGLPVE